MSRLFRSLMVCALAVSGYCAQAHAQTQVTGLVTHEDGSVSVVDVTDPANPLVVQTRWAGDPALLRLKADSDGLKLAGHTAGADTLLTFSPDQPSPTQHAFPGTAIDDLAISHGRHRAWMVDGAVDELRVYDYGPTGPTGLATQVDYQATFNASLGPVVALKTGGVVVSYGQGRFHRWSGDTPQWQYLGSLNTWDPLRLAGHPSGDVIVADRYNVHRLDPDTQQWIHRHPLIPIPVPVPGGPAQVLPDPLTHLKVDSAGARIFAMQSSPLPRIFVLDADTLKLETTLYPAGCMVRDLAPHPDGEHVILACRAGLEVMSISSGQRTQQMPLNPANGREIDLLEFGGPVALVTDEWGGAPGTLEDEEVFSLTWADVNGDGRDDLCGLLVQNAPGAPGVYCQLNENGVLGARSLWSGDFGLQISGVASYHETLAFPDLNGDGQQDLCGRQDTGLWCAISTGSSFAPALPWAGWLGDASGFDQPQYWQTIRYGDLDADGSDDVCARTAQGVSCALSFGHIFGAPSLWTFQFSDIDGWDQGPEYWTTLQMGEVDGSPGQDLCGRGPDGFICVTSLSDVFEDHDQIWAPETSDAMGWDQSIYYTSLQLADLDGDGMDDLCGRGMDGVRCGVNTGLYNFVGMGAASAQVPEFSDASGWSDPEHGEAFWMVDVDGDGRADACGRGDAGILCASSRGTIIFGFPHFDPASIRVNNFGDVYGWDGDPHYWRTVGPAQIDGASGAEFCGRGDAGVLCSRW